jgi:hypothetical protein
MSLKFVDNFRTRPQKDLPVQHRTDLSLLTTAVACSDKTGSGRPILVANIEIIHSKLAEHLTADLVPMSLKRWSILQ